MSLTYDAGFASFNPSLSYSPEFFGHSGEAWYPHFTLNVPLPHQFTLKAGIGHQFVDDTAAYGVPGYTDWNAGVRYDFGSNSIEAGYYDTNIHENRCSVGCGATGIISYVRNF